MNEDWLWMTRSGVGSRLETKFSPPLCFDPGYKYELALVSLESYYSFPNITERNNCLKVFFIGKWHEIHIPVGCYELEDRQIVETGKLLKKEG